MHHRLLLIGIFVAAGACISAPTTPSSTVDTFHLEVNEAAGDAVVSVDSNAELRERNLYRNQVSGAWRMTVRVKRADASKPVEMRAFISQDGKSLSETWSYILPAESEKP